MGYHFISHDLKLAAIWMYGNGVLNLDDILHSLQFSHQTFYRILKLWRETGDVVKPGKSLRGKICNLEYEDIQYLLCLIRNNSDYFLDELLNLLRTNRFISVHYTTIHHELKRAGVSRMKLKRVALERDEECRAAFVERMAQYTPEQLGFLDEVSKDEQTPSRRYARSRKGTRAAKNQPFIRGRHTSTEALLTLDGIVAGIVVEGSMTKDMFLEYLELNVVCHNIVKSWFHTHHCPSSLCVPPFLGRLAFLLWTMLKFTTEMRLSSLRKHLVRGQILLHYIHLANFFQRVRIEYLPPYLPDLNPIEEAFLKIKHWIRRHSFYYGSAEGNEIFYDMWEVLDIITATDAEGYFFHAGYF